METKRYLISFLLLIASYNVYGGELAEDCGCDETVSDVHSNSDGYVAEGSAISSQFVLPDGSVETHARETSISSGGVRQTFESLKHEANQFVTKQKDSINIPNVHIPIPSFHQHSNFIAGSQAEQQQQQQQQQYYSGSVGAHGGNVVYQSVPATKVISSSSVKQEQHEHKKIITNSKGSGSNNELASAEQSEYIQPSGSEYSYVSAPTHGGQILSQTYESESQQGSSYHSISPSSSSSGKKGIPLNLYNPQQHNDPLNTYISTQVPHKIMQKTEYSQQQKEQKYTAVPLTAVKISYAYDGKNAYKTETYSDNTSKYIPISYEEYEAARHQPPQPGQTIEYKSPTIVREYQKEEHESSHSHTITGTGGGSQDGSLVHKLISSSIPKQQQQQQQQSSQEGFSSQSYAQTYGSSGSPDASQQGSVLVHGVQTIPSKHSSSSSSSSSYNYQSSSSGQYGGSLGSGTHGAILVHGVPLGGNSVSSSYSNGYSSGSQYGSGGSASVPGKTNFHEIKTSYSLNSSTINGKKTENREASVSLNNNGVLDSYHVKS